MNLLTSSDFNKLLSSFKYPANDNVAKALGNWIKSFTNDNTTPIDNAKEKGFKYALINTILQELIYPNVQVAPNYENGYFYKYALSNKEQVISLYDDIKKVLDACIDYGNYFDFMQKELKEGILLPYMLTMNLPSNLSDQKRLQEYQSTLRSTFGKSTYSKPDVLDEKYKNVRVILIPLKKVEFLFPNGGNIISHTAHFQLYFDKVIFKDSSYTLNDLKEHGYLSLLIDETPIGLNLSNLVSFIGVKKVKQAYKSFDHLKLLASAENLNQQISINYNDFKADDIGTILTLNFVYKYTKLYNSKYKLDVLNLIFKRQQPKLYENVRKSLIQLSTKAVVLKDLAKEEARLKKMYATSFQPLQNNTKLALETIQNSSFAKSFKNVELDGTGTAKTKVDYEKFDELQKSWMKIKRILPEMSSQKPDLRFRKLGKHKAVGLYFPFVNCISIDVRQTGSFVHEYGHYLDYKKYNQASINNNDFIDFSIMYRKQLKGKVPDNKIDYYSLPTEIFARCFEVYIYEQNQNLPELQYFLDNRFAGEYKPILDNWQIVKPIMQEIIK